MASSESRSVVVLALVANSLIAVLKFIAAAISGSTAMLAEGFHSVADSGNQLFLLRGTAAARFAPSVRFHSGAARRSSSGPSWLPCSCSSVVAWWLL